VLNFIDDAACRCISVKAATAWRVRASTANAAERRQRDREGQEDPLSARGLVVNRIVLWNTRYIDAVLAQLRSENFPIFDKAIARLDPLGFDHINRLGRYAFAVYEAVARGELRPLHASREDIEAAEGRSFQ
jgi:hypothetical protein